MLTRVRRHLVGQWAGFLALFLVLTSGTAYALAGSNTVFSDDIVNGHVRAPDLADNSVGSRKLVNESVLGADIKNGTITSGDVAENSLLGVDVRDGTVTSADVADNSVTGGDIADSSILGHDVSLGALGGWHITNDTLTGLDVLESSLSTVPMAAQGGTGRSGTGFCQPFGTTFSACGGTRVTVMSTTRVLILGSAQVRTISTDGASSGDCQLEVDGVPQPGSRMSVRQPGPATVGLSMMTVSVLSAGQHWLGVACNRTAGTLQANTALAGVVLSGS